MKIFVTGASGWIGSAVVPELISAGHQVVGLARTDAQVAALNAAGAQVTRGTIDDLDLLHHEATVADGVIHLAFKHDMAFSGNFAAAVEADRNSIATFGDALAGSDRPFIIAAGVVGVAPAGQVATERDGHQVDPAVAQTHGGAGGRLLNAEYTLALAERGVRSMVMRLSPTVHGNGDNGFMAGLVSIARAKGTSGYLADGANRWPAVHRLDAARLFRLALEQAPAGSTLHAVDDQGVPVREIAEVIGRHLNVPTVSVASEQAMAHFGWLGTFVGTDCRASSALTRELLGWQPTQPGLIADLEAGHYFTSSPQT